mmetsp:Transcript_123509/g.193798  ORF Transcript_123509/g.193798 Transcript_123509/m.193798 type:complete len:225 (-) Transcript_123509:737-1411(-)
MPFFLHSVISSPSFARNSSNATFSLWFSAIISSTFSPLSVDCVPQVILADAFLLISSISLRNSAASCSRFNAFVCSSFWEASNSCTWRLASSASVLAPWSCTSNCFTLSSACFDFSSSSLREALASRSFFKASSNPAALDLSAAMASRSSASTFAVASRRVSASDNFASTLLTDSFACSSSAHPLLICSCKILASSCNCAQSLFASLNLLSASRACCLATSSIS